MVKSYYDLPKTLCATTFFLVFQAAKENSWGKLFYRRNGFLGVITIFVEVIKRQHIVLRNLKHILEEKEDCPWTLLEMSYNEKLEYLAKANLRKF